MLQLIRNTELEVALDVSNVDDNLPSVAFNISVSWNMPFQKAKIEILQCWFECAALDVFQSKIKALMSLDSGSVTLADLSNTPIFVFSKNGNELETEIHAKDTVGLGKISLISKGYSTELAEVAGRLGDFEKWW